MNTFAPEVPKNSQWGWGPPLSQNQYLSVEKHSSAVSCHTKLYGRGG